MESSENYYSVLNISRTACSGNIRKAFLKLTREYHPDKCHGSETTKKFNDIRQAYSVLSDPVGRNQYDCKLDLDQFFENPFKDFEMNDESMDVDMTDNPILEDMIKGKPTSTSTTTSGSEKRCFIFNNTLPKDPPVKKDLFVSLEEICTGAEKRLKIERNIALGNGLTRSEEKILVVRIMPGWKAGTIVTFSNEGHQKPDSLPADVIITIRDKEHEHFTRDAQNNLIYKCKLTLKDALICSFIDIPTIDGRTVRIKHDGTITPGMKTIIEGYGLPLRNQANQRANLIITYDINFPKHLSSQQRQVICDSLPKH